MAGHQQMLLGAAAAAPPPPSGLTIVQSTAITGYLFDNVFQQNVSAVGAGNAVAFVVGMASVDSAPTSITDSAGGSWTLAYSAVTGADQTYRTYIRNSISDGITWIRANFSSSRPGYVAAVEVSGGTLVLDASGATTQSSTTNYSSAFTSTAASTLCLYFAHWDNAENVTATSPLTLRSPATAEYIAYAAGIFPTAGSNTAQITITNARAGGRGWAVFRAGP